MGLAKQIRKLADYLDALDFAASRRLRELYRLFGRGQKWGKLGAVLDVGANRGHFARATAQCFAGAAVRAFELLAVCQPALQKMARHFPQLRVHQVALGGQSAEMTERHKELWPQTREERPVSGRAELGSGPFFGKLDAQGCELHALRGAGAVLQDTNVIMAGGLFGGPADFPAVGDLLRQRGLRFTEFIGETRLPPHGEPACAPAIRA